MPTAPNKPISAFLSLHSLAGYYIYSAELRLYPIDVIGTNWDYEGFVGMLESGWNEPTLTWNNNTTSVKAGTGWIDAGQGVSLQ